MAVKSVAAEIKLQFPLLIILDQATALGLFKLKLMVEILKALVQEEGTYKYKV